MEVGIDKANALPK